MESIFRTATTQAILDIIAEHGTRSRFGHLLTEEDASAVAAKVVDLFEMTLRLRARTGLLGSAPTAAEPPSESRTMHRHSGSPSPTLGSLRPKRRANWTEEGHVDAFPTTVNASEFIEADRKRPKVPEVAPSASDTDSFGFRLPRQRNRLSEEERATFLRRARS
jgi:hypothetical protein